MNCHGGKSWKEIPCNVINICQAAISVSDFIPSVVVNTTKNAKTAGSELQGLFQVTQSNCSCGTHSVALNTHMDTGFSHTHYQLYTRAYFKKYIINKLSCSIIYELVKNCPGSATDIPILLCLFFLTWPVKIYKEVDGELPSTSSLCEWVQHPGLAEAKARNQ